MKIDFDFLTGRNNPYLKDYYGYLVHDEIIPSLKLLQEAAKKEIGAKIQIISSFRDFEKQKIIWNNKASGIKAIYDDDDHKIEIKNLNETELIEKIMRFSALPGASRHHWGTDIDIFDASKLAKDKVNLTPSECGPGDIFCELHEWLDEKIKKKQAYGFYRPYHEDLNGVSIEKWHLSYAPLSQLFFDKYTIDVFEKNIIEADILLKEVLLKDLSFYFDKYITNINLP